MRNAEMLLSEIKNLLGCRSLTSENLLEKEIEFCFGADLMSDVLRFARIGSLLLTGITNKQVLQVAEIMDLKGIIFVRGKEPEKSIITEAEKRKLPLMTTDKLLFDTCGILYTNGLRGGKTLLEEKHEPGSSIQPVI
jgi:predicted transcriptional regulator